MYLNHLLGESQCQKHGAMLHAFVLRCTTACSYLFVNSVKMHANWLGNG